MFKFNFSTSLNVLSFKCVTHVASLQTKISRYNVGNYCHVGKQLTKNAFLLTRGFIEPPEGARGPRCLSVEMLRSSNVPKKNSHTGATFSFAERHERLSGTNVCKEPMPQQLSQGCAPHTNEGIDRFLRCTVVFTNLNWCTNLQLEQGWLPPS